MSYIPKLVEFMDTDTDSGKLYKQLLEALNMETGLDGNPLLHNYLVYKWCITHKWQLHLWDFASKQDSVGPM